MTLSISLEQKAALEDLSDRLGYNWGGNPNISKLIRAIADGEVPVGAKEPGVILEQTKRVARKAIAKISQALIDLEQL